MSWVPGARDSSICWVEGGLPQFGKREFRVCGSDLARKCELLAFVPTFSGIISSSLWSSSIIIVVILPVILILIPTHPPPPPPCPPRPPPCPHPRKTRHQLHSCHGRGNHQNSGGVVSLLLLLLTLIIVTEVVSSSSSSIISIISTISKTI